MSAGRIAARFAALKAANKSGFISFITAGDPDVKTCAQLLAGLPKAGADIIELGMPFSDPMADGPAIQQANMRALKARITLRKTLELVRGFRKKDAETPLVLMGYYNPIYSYGPEKFLRDAKEAVDAGLPDYGELTYKATIALAGIEAAKEAGFPASGEERNHARTN